MFNLRRQRARQTLAVALMGLGLTCLTVPSAVAAPANDTLQGATVIASIPYSNTANLTTATTGVLDRQACNSSDETHSIWYKFVPTVSQRLTADTLRSNSTVYLAVFEKRATGSVVVGDECDRRVTNFPFTAGKTYYIMAYDYPFDGEPVASRSVLRLRPSLSSSVQLNARGTVSAAAGDAVISGTVTCSRAATTNVFISVRQRINATAFATGSGETQSIACSPSVPVRFSVTVPPDFGGAPFKVGDAGVTASASQCDSLECTSSGPVRSIVSLRSVA